MGSTGAYPKLIEYTMVVNGWAYHYGGAVSYNGKLYGSSKQHRRKCWRQHVDNPDFLCSHHCGLLSVADSSFLKKKEEEEAMRKNAQIGDEITTIGGIVGRIISVKEETDTVVIETGTDRAKLRVKRWAIGSVDTEREEPAEKKEKADKSKK